MSLLESEVDEELMEIPVKGFENVSKDEFVVVLTRISDHNCNILDQPILAGKLLKNINEKKANVSPFLKEVQTAFSSFHNVAVKAKQVQFIRIERNFFKDLPERSQIHKMWNELVKACGISASHFYCSG